MRLADFIEQNNQRILKEWVEFAEKSCAAGSKMDLAALRDHAVEMLKAIVKDLRTPQTDAEQVAKSKGESAPEAGAADTAAEVHGAGRAESGFTVGEMVSEYRALRASVIRLWTLDSGSLTGEDLEDLMRFNETIDQALAESTERFTKDVDSSREIFVGILGHDLGTPLNAVITASEFILETPNSTEKHLAMTATTLRSARRMKDMVSALLDFAVGRMGPGLSMNLTLTDLRALVSDVVEEVSVANPDSQVQFSHSGDLNAMVDTGRISQVLTNLINNAIQFGTAKDVIGVSASGEAQDVVIRVHNSGVPIPASEIGGIFSPFKRLTTARTSADSSVGLGLYIVERIVAAHGGSIDVRSSEAAGTLFSIRIPRAPAPPVSPDS
ncbi:MAG: sensor histidine kinase [Gemmatimonadaceae bacterium]|nr:sensor histidine kinase [Gemmatimonadaceae bacterium]